MSVEPPAEGPQDRRRYAWEQEREMEPSPREFRIVLPAAMGEAEVLRRVAKSLEAVRASYVRHADFWANEIMRERVRDQPNGERIAYGRGLVDAYRGAQQHLDEELLGNLGLWLAYELQEVHTPAETRPMAEHLGWRWEERPEIPLPGMRLDAGTLVELVRMQRTAFALMALQLNKSAVVDNVGERFYESYLGSARSMAQAADDLEFLLARAHGADADLGVFLDEHGTWQSRIVESEKGPDDDGD